MRKQETPPAEGPSTVRHLPPAQAPGVCVAVWSYLVLGVVPRGEEECLRQNARSRAIDGLEPARLWETAFPGVLR